MVDIEREREWMRRMSDEAVAEREAAWAVELADMEIRDALRQQRFADGLCPACGAPRYIEGNAFMCPQCGVLGIFTVAL